jgi:hypothetical protein
LTCFCAQEVIIPGIYLYETVLLLKVVLNENTRSIIWQLFAINFIIVLMGVGLLALEYKDLRVLEQTFKGAIYSVKLKLEFAVLGKLVTVIGTTRDKHLSDTIDRTEDFVDSARTVSDFSHASPTRTTSRPCQPREKLSKTFQASTLTPLMKAFPIARNQTSIPLLSHKMSTFFQHNCGQDHPQIQDAQTLKILMRILYGRSRGPD